MRFVLSTSGHIAAVVNPPVDPPKRSFWASDSNQSQEPEAWKAGIEKKDGTWWPDWTNWLDERCGKMIAPPTMGSKKYKPLADAPGTLCDGVLIILKSWEPQKFSEESTY